MKIIMAGLICFFSVFGTAKAQYYTPIHNAQAPDYIAVIKHFGIPYGPVPTLNSTRQNPGAIFFNTADSSIYQWTGTAWRSTGGTGYIDSIIAANNYNNFGIDSSSRLISGAVIIDSGFKGHTTILDVKINGRYYTIPAVDSFQISPSSVSSARYTLAYVDTLGNFGLKDCPYGNPVELCGVDDQSEFVVAVYFIPANSTTPYLVSNNDVYKEGVEWTLSGTARFNPLYTTLPFQGTYSLLDTAVTPNTYIDFTYGSLLNVSDFAMMSYQVKLLSAFSSTCRMQFSFYNGNSLVSANVVQIRDGTHGYVRTLANAYQAVAVQFNEFNFYSGSFNKIRLSFTGVNTSGLQIDNFVLQSGGLNTGSNIVQSVNSKTGHVYLEYGDTLRYNTDSTQIELWHNGTMRKLASLPTFLSYPRSIDTCIIISQVGKDISWTFNPNCRGGGGDSSAFTTTTQLDDSTFTLNRLNGTKDTIQIISGSVSVTDTTSLSDRINTKKDKSDSTLSTGYATQYDLTKTKDSLQTNIDLKKNSIDSVSGVATDYVTQYQRKKTSDSLLALILTKLSPTDTAFLHGRLVESYLINAGGDSSILTLYDGSRYAVKIGAAGSSGTVTDFTAGTLSPLFTTSVATSTTTPALTFNLSNAAAYTNFGNRTSGSTTPTFFTNPFSDSLKISADSIYQQVNGTWKYQFRARNLDTSFLQLVANDLRVTQVINKGLYLQNATPATAGIPTQYSPPAIFEGQVYASSITQSIKHRIFLDPTSATNSMLTFQASVNGGGFTNYLSIGALSGQNGQLTFGLGSKISINGAGGISTDNGYIKLNAPASAVQPSIVGYNDNAVNMSNASGTPIMHAFKGGFSNLSSGTSTNIFAGFSPGIGMNASSAASYEAMRINVTETTLPVGPNYLLRIGTGGGSFSSKFDITNNGTTIVGGGTAQASALFQVESTTKGILIPRMTTTQMNAIASPATALGLYNTDAKMALDYDGAAYKSAGVVSGSFSGVGTATTVFTVTFGGTQPNATYKVNVTPTAALSAAFFYVTNKTTTTFDVTYLAGLTGTVTFDWAIYQ